LESQLNALIQFENVTLGYRRRSPVLSNLTFSIQEGEFFGIVGANGSGKTTILRAMLKILTPIKGRIAFAGGDQRMRFGYVPQRAFIDEMFPLTAREIVLMGRYGTVTPGRRPTPRDREVVERQLALAGIPDLADERFRDMSGGQKQRTLIARALAAEAKVLLMDEPTDGMDLEGEHAILALISRLHTGTGITVVYVTHRLSELANTAQRLLLLHDGQVRVGYVAELFTPAMLREIYGVDAIVGQVGGKRVVMT
jgi:ABC-type Mn2+/Zn2+ transport system ATPase subunit